uniref:Uncharacterized protein n=1 Tax=Pristionchus pacificus TaxID=54126 RepID=A0A2A6CVT0_PRIPA|eukprot:PDM82186.1 hypothetical protein PRIPAC_36579 [Pristionchus pacificus]
MVNAPICNHIPKINGQEPKKCNNSSAHDKRGYGCLSALVTAAAAAGCSQYPPLLPRDPIADQKSNLLAAASIYLLPSHSARSLKKGKFGSRNSAEHAIVRKVNTS